jgi:hypothetical protein
MRPNYRSPFPSIKLQQPNLREASMLNKILKFEAFLDVDG